MAPIKDLAFIDSSIDNEIDILKEGFLKSILNILIFLTFFGLPVSLYRIFEFGFLNVYILQIFLAICVVTAKIFQNRLNMVFIKYLIIAVFSAVAIGDLVQFGVFSAGFFFVIETIFIVSMLYGIRGGITTTGIFLLITSAIAYAWNHSILVFPTSESTFNQSISVWLILIICVTITGAIFYISTAEMLKAKKMLLNKIHAMATHDLLTGLANLSLIMSKLDKAIAISKRRESKAAVLFIDLDGFKPVNDTYGHEAGDIILNKVGQKLTSSVREMDSVGRIGGDEFLIVLPDIADIKIVERICQRIIDAISKELNYQDSKLNVSASIGIAMYPDNAHNAKLLVKAADTAMYNVKSTGKNNYKFLNGQVY